MASSSSLSASASSRINPNSAPYLPICPRHCSLPHSKLSFRLSPKPIIRLSSKSSWDRSTVVKAQLNEVADGSSNAAPNSSSKADLPATEAKDVKASSEPVQESLALEESISDFIAQVADLVKLVDSRDIVELQLKQVNCEVWIRKKEALPQPPAPAPVMMHAPALPPTYQAAPSASAPSSAAPIAALPPAPKSASSSHPPLKCPMAGTFYRSPAPGEPAFVKVGDKVQKGQVVCVIEAMKLMNEIEADQSGTVIEILVDDGKPVSVDMPLFVIAP